MSCLRGEVWWVDWKPARGAEQRGRRPALVVQNDRGNTSSPVTVVAAISSDRLPAIYPFTVRLNAGEGGLSRTSHVNCAQLLTIDQGRLLDRAGTLSETRMLEVDEALRYELGI